MSILCQYYEAVRSAIIATATAWFLVLYHLLRIDEFLTVTFVLGQKHKAFI